MHLQSTLIIKVVTHARVYVQIYIYLFCKTVGR